MDDEFKWYLCDIDLFQQGLGIAADGTAQPKEVAAFHAEKGEMFVEAKGRAQLYATSQVALERQRQFFCTSKGYKCCSVFFI